MLMLGLNVVGVGVLDWCGDLVAAEFVHVLMDKQYCHYYFAAVEDRHNP